MRFCATFHIKSYSHPSTRTTFPFEHKYVPLRNHFGHAALNGWTDPEKYYVEEAMCIHKTRGSLSNTHLYTHTCAQHINEHEQTCGLSKRPK